MINLSKGQKIDLTKKEPSLKLINVGLGWDEVEDASDEDIDCDASIALLGADGKVISHKMDETCVYFNNTDLPGIHHTGDNRTGEGDGDDETIEIDLSKIPAKVDKVCVFMNIYKGEERKQSLASLNNSYIRLYKNDSSEEEICRFNMDESSPTATGLIAGELYRHEGQWKFSAIGEALKDASYVGSVLRRFGY